MQDFPHWRDAPAELRDSEDKCGPLAVWQILSHFDIVADTADLLAVCRFSPDVGTHTIGLAVALVHFGLGVEFYSDLDPDPQPVERELYQEAHNCGLMTHPAPPLHDFLSGLGWNRVGILFYESADNLGHFTAVLGNVDDEAIVPNEGGMTIAELDRKWRAPGIFRQCVVAFIPTEA